jgi:hypothetical protein
VARPSRAGYWLKPDVVEEFERERRDLIACAPTAVEVRDGRTFLVRRLPPVARKAVDGAQARPDASWALEWDSDYP